MVTLGFGREGEVRQPGETRIEGSPRIWKYRRPCPLVTSTAPPGSRVMLTAEAASSCKRMAVAAGDSDRETCRRRARSRLPRPGIGPGEQNLSIHQAGGGALRAPARADRDGRMRRCSGAAAPGRKAVRARELSGSRIVELGRCQGRIEGALVAAGDENQPRGEQGCGRVGAAGDHRSGGRHFFAGGIVKLGFRYPRGSASATAGDATLCRKAAGWRCDGCALPGAKAPRSTSRPTGHKPGAKPAFHRSRPGRPQSAPCRKAAGWRCDDCVPGAG